MKKILLIAGAVLVIALVVLSTLGVFRNRISPDDATSVHYEPFSGTELVVKAGEVDDIYRAVGTVRSTTQSVISGQVNGAVVAVFVKDGDEVTKGQKLLKADDREYLALLNEASKGVEMAKVQLQQANQFLLQAQAQYQQALLGKRMAEQNKAQAEQSLASAEENERRAKSDFARTEELYAGGSGSITTQAYEAARAGYVAAMAQAEQTRIAVKTAEAAIGQATEAVSAAASGVAQATSGVEGAKLGIERADEGLNRAKLAFSYTEVVAPDDGFIGRKFVESGDLIYPGKPLVDFYSRSGFEVLASIREALFDKIIPGSELLVSIESRGLLLKGTVREKVPSADPMSRSFQIKVALPAEESLFPGMFARVHVPVGKRVAIVIPHQAVRKVGMLTTVMVKASEGKGVRRFVKLGRSVENGVEVISGLSSGEIIEVKGVAR